MVFINIAYHFSFLQSAENCFAGSFAFIRVYVMESTGNNINGYIDLLNIQGLSKCARKPLNQGVFKLPFFAEENLVNWVVMN